MKSKKEILRMRLGDLRDYCEKEQSRIEINISAKGQMFFEMKTNIDKKEESNGR